MFLTPVIVKKSHDYQTGYVSEDPKQGYNHAKFERFQLNNVQEKKLKVLVKSGNFNYLP